MRIDAHQHFWMYSPEQYGWISDEMPELKRNFLPEDLKPKLDGQLLDGSIVVQARQDLDETRWLLALADEHDFVKGVVGWVDLCSPDLPAQLDEFAANRKLLGVRHILQGEADDEFMLRTEFRRGIARLAEYGLTYDLLLYPRHLPVAMKLVREFPEQRFVLDHLAKPAITEGLMDPWERDIRELARFGNVFCKLSGMVTEARWKQWTPQDFRPYLDVVCEAFGGGRLMIGSDWPVCTLSGSYEETMGMVMDYARQSLPDEIEGILGANCTRFYGVE
ncbi:MAG: amidohydrolase family protein [Terracidiphilus sp.]